MKNLDTPEYLLSILTYELGDIHKCFVRKKAYPDEAKIWEVELKVALGDTIIMSRVLADSLGYDVGELTKEGLERYSDRQKDLEKFGYKKE